VKRSGGILSIDVKLPEKLMLNKVAKPSPDSLKTWRSKIEDWLNDAVRSVDRLGTEQGLTALSSTPSVKILHNNFESFWSIVEDCYERSKTFSDFNAFLMSKIVNEVWGYDTAFSRFSECQQVFADEFDFLLSRSGDYSRLLNEAKEIPSNAGVSGGVSDQEPWMAPFWYHCDCGSKVRLFLIEKDGSLSGQGNCMGCGKYQELEFGAKDDPDVSGVASRISARAISMGLVFFNGLMPCCYVGGVGGVRYLMEAEHVARGLGIPFPPVVVWRPHDKYLGVGQIEATLELKRICRDLDAPDFSAAKDLLESRISKVRERLDYLEESKQAVMEKLREHPKDEALKERIKTISISRSKLVKSSNLSVISHKLKILENVSTVSDLVPSIIDYAVNVGLRETSEQWIQHLGENGNLSSEVHLNSALNTL